MNETPPRPARRWWRVVLLLALAWVVFLYFFGPKRMDETALGPPKLEVPRPPRRADYGWTLRDLDGAPVSFEKFRGRAVFLNLWATWCGPCREELPSIANLADNRRLKDVAFVCVSTDQSAEALKAYVRDKRWAMTVLRATELPAAFGTEYLPATFLIAPDGTVAAFEEGPAQWDDPSAVDYLEKLAAKPAPVRP
jgi:thiol-disulfide isomerase/thioredoxin